MKLLSIIPKIILIIEEAKRAIKRPADDRYEEIDRKRSTSDRRFEAPPPPRFDSTINNRSSDAYRSGNGSSSSSKRDDYKRDSFKREMEVSRHSSSSYDRNSSTTPIVSSKDSRYADSRSADYRTSSSTTSRAVVDDRSTKSRYMDTSSYSDRSSGTSNPWSAQQTTFGTMSSAVGIPDSRGWGGVDNGQDRYDRTYNERKMQSQSAGFMDQSRQPSFMPNSGGGGRPGDRYGMNGRY
uniref:CSON006884 protein n=1 Tax=Culicoides sonorensis TaxID=179676 RepID=A0A336MU32_CULSO